MYEDYLSVVVDEPAAIAVLIWGQSDRYTWLSSFKPRLELDAQMQGNFSWNAIAYC
jgi:endo-1,4-beta-xylanase